MTEDDTPAPEKNATEMHYFRSTNAALSVITGPATGSDPQPTRVRFAPFQEKEEGDFVKRGYLATDDPDVIERLKADSTCSTITKKQFDKATDTGSDKVHPLPV